MRTHEDCCDRRGAKVSGKQAIHPRQHRITTYAMRRGGMYS
jgi:hypothetical protein